MFQLRVSHRASDLIRHARNDAERKLALFMIAGERFQQMLGEPGAVHAQLGYRSALPARWARSG
jgi:hypothetical protein